MTSMSRLQFLSVACGQHENVLMKIFGGNSDFGSVNVPTEKKERDFRPNAFVRCLDVLLVLTCSATLPFDMC